MPSHHTQSLPAASSMVYVFMNTSSSLALQNAVVV